MLLQPRGPLLARMQAGEGGTAEPLAPRWPNREEGREGRWRSPDPEMRGLGPMLDEACVRYGASAREILGGSRRRPARLARCWLVGRLVRGMGWAPAEVGRALGISTQTVTRLLSKPE